MAPPFVVPLSLHDLQSPPSFDQPLLSALNVVSLDSLQPEEVDELVKGLAFDLADKEVLCIEEQAIFDQVYSLVSGYTSLEPTAKASLIESLCSNFSVLLPNISSLLKSAQDSSGDAASLGDHIHSHRNAFRIYSYFIQCIAIAEETGADANKEKPTSRPNGKAKQPRKKHFPQVWDWEVQRARIVRLIAAALEEDLNQLFGTSQPEETLLAFLAKGAFTMLENLAVSKDKDMKDALCNVIGACSTKYHYVAQSTASILHLLHKHEHLTVCLAEAVASAEQKYHDGSLAVALIREIGKLNPQDYARDGVGADNIGKFLVEIADRLPRLVATNVGILMPHFGGESYKIRSALISVLSKLVSKAFKDGDGSAATEMSRLRSKQALIGVMMERSRDTSAYTRSRVLQTWADLCEEHAVSIGLWNQVADMAAGRLEDKAAIVRKSALHLLATLLQYNPFGPQLRTAAFEATLDKYKAELDNMSSHSEADSSGKVQNGPELGQSSDTDLEQLGENEGREVEPEKPEQETDGDAAVGGDGAPSQAETQTRNSSYTSDVGGVEQTRALVASLESGLCFAKCIAGTMPVLVQLLASCNASDVEYTIQLLMCARQFNVDGADSSLRKMLPLIFSQERAIQDAVENAFLTIYVKKSPFDTALNLINLTMEASIGDLTSMERIICTLVTKGDISQNMVSALWDCFTFNAPGITLVQSRGALVVLTMVAKTSPKILNSHLQNVVDIGFGRWAKEDMLLARTACKILQYLSEEERPVLLSSHKIFNNLATLILTSGLPEESWYGTAEQVINTIYTLHPMPEAFVSALLRNFHTSISVQSEPSLAIPITSSASGESETMIDKYPASVTMLSRFLFLVGHIALKHFVYIESCVRKLHKQCNNMQKTVAENQEPSDKEDKKEGDNISAELGVAASEDMRIDALHEQAERDILSGGKCRKYLIGSCAPVVTKICKNFSLLQKFPILQSSAMLALCKLMLLDADFCEGNLQLLFTVAQNAAEDSVRSNCIIALGDLAVRFPNLLEPWTEHVYGRLHDSSKSVRKNAVLVLSHLILNDMMKVKGHISEMTLRLDDEDLSISNSVKLFFHELSKKGNNPIYNLLPDVLSRLSSMKNLQQESFNNIMQFLISSIKKDKQMEGLIEKLCHRFLGTIDSEQWRNIAYCLSQLTYTEKGIRKLADLFKSYQHTLAEEQVVNHFKTIISKAKKFAKAEVKAIIDEFEAKIIQHHEDKKEQEEIMCNAQAHLAGQFQSEELLHTAEGAVVNNPGDGIAVTDNSEEHLCQNFCNGDEDNTSQQGNSDNHVQTSEGFPECEEDGTTGNHSSKEGTAQELLSSECHELGRLQSNEGTKLEDPVQQPKRLRMGKGEGAAACSPESPDAASADEKENINDADSQAPTLVTRSSRKLKVAKKENVGKTLVRPRRRCVE